MRTPRTWTVVGFLCRSKDAAKAKMLAFRSFGPTSGNDWGLVSIKLPAGEKPLEVGKIRVPPPPALLKRLEGLLSSHDVRRTAEGREALQLVQAALKRRR